MRSVAAGDTNAFREVYKVYEEQVYNTALGYVQNKADAEEIMQEVFVNIYRKAHTFKGNSAVGTWIYRITINTSLNFLKKKKRYIFLEFKKEEDIRTNFDHPGVLLENKEHTRAIFQAIHTLVDAQKTAFILSYVEELPRQEVADIMQLSLKAVESLLQRAKKKLRTQLATLYDQERKDT